MREIKFRAWDRENKEWVYSEPMPDIGFWNWVKYDITTVFNESTGLTDKNGIEIYEGDITKTWFSFNDENEDSYVRIVKYGLIRSEYSEEPNTPGIGFNVHSEWNGVPIYNEIIGNIYESPELLKDTA